MIVATHDERLLPLADRVVEMTPRAPSDAQFVKQLVLELGRRYSSRVTAVISCM